MWRTTLDIRKLARRQRWMIWLILLAIVWQLLGAFLFWHRAVGHVSFLAIHLAAYLPLVVGLVLLLTAQGKHILMIIIGGLLMFSPCASLLLLLLVNMSVTNTLRNAGLRIGLLGVKKEDMERLLNFELCFGCGYNLTGNVSGRCPECGRPIPSGQQDKIPTV